MARRGGRANGRFERMGRAAAECMADDGARVAVLARRKDLLDETVAALRERGSPDAVGLAVDVTDARAVEAAFAELGERWGALNALVNTVGPGDTGTIDTLSDEGWARSLELGLMGAVRCTRAALPWLRKAPWARIVNVSAHSTRRQTPTLIGYTAAKSALTSMSKNLAKTLAQEKILVNTVSPGHVPLGRREVVARGNGGAARDRSEQPRGSEPDHRGGFRRAVATSGAPGCPTRSAAVIAFLASRRNSYMTGANVNVDGGSDFALMARRSSRTSCSRRRASGPGSTTSAIRSSAKASTCCSTTSRAPSSPISAAWCGAGGSSGISCSGCAWRIGSRAIPRSLARPVPAPIFVVGLPRTGTTALSHLLAQDPDTRSLRVWESAQPVPPPEPRATDDPRIAAAEQQLAAMHQLSPQLAAMHEDTATGPTENHDLLGMSFRTFHFEGMAWIPRYVEWWLACDMVPAYRTS